MTQSLLEQALTQYASQESLSERDRFAPQCVQVGDFNVRYLRQKRANAPTLVLLNGLPQSIRMWESALPQLEQQFDLLAFDIPGFGLSTAHSKDMTPNILADAVVQVMDHFDIGKAHLVGPDVGVPIALTAAINHPQRFASVNIFDGPGSYPPKLSSILMAVVKSRFVRWLAKGINKKAVMKTNFLTAVKEGYHHFQPNARAIQEYYDITHNPQAHNCAMDFFASYQSALPWIEQRLPTLSVPVLITWGEKDPFVLVDNAHHLSQLIPDNKLVTFANASHFSSEDAGADYVAALTEWASGGFNSAKPTAINRLSA